MKSRFGRQVGGSIASLFIVLVAAGYVSAYGAGAPMTRSVIEAGEKPAQRSYGENILRADQIVLGEYTTNGKVIVKEVLKGNNSSAGKTLSLVRPILMGCMARPVPTIKRAAVLLKGNDAIAIYDTPDQIALVRMLTPVYANPSEKSRLTELAVEFRAAS